MKIRLADRAKYQTDKMAKIALASTPRAQLGLYCLEPGQSEKVHAHDGQDKVYVVLEGRGRFALDGAEEVIIGSSRYVALGDGAAEVAFIVEEDFQGQGIAHRMLSHLAGIALGQGFTVFEAFVLPENRSMLAVFSHCGFGVTQHREDGAVHVRLELARAGPGSGP